MSTDVADITGHELLKTGQLAAARERFWHAADVAGDDATALAVAALGLGGIWVNEHRSILEHARVTALQRRALARVSPSSALACRLRMRLAAERSYQTGDIASARAALEDARRHGDPVVLAEALSLTHHCLLGPEHGAERLALADELILASARTGRAIDALMGLAWRTIDLVLAGDRRGARSLAELRERIRVHRCDALDYLVAALDVMQAIRAGRLTEAEQLAETCYRLGVDVGDPDALGWYGAQLVAIRWFQGHGEELLPQLSEMADSTTLAEPNDAFVAAIAALAAAAGRDGEARAALASLRARGLTSMPTSSIWLATLVGVCEAAHALGDVGAAREVYPHLLPFADRPVMASLAVVCYGSTHRPLGLAAWTMGELDTAIEHLEAAVDASLALGNLPSRAIAMASLAGALRERDRPDDLRRAAGLRQAAVDDARRFGMTAWADAWERVDQPADRTVACRRDGRVWLVRVGQRDAVVPHSVGMGYLTRLIDQMGVEITAVELASDHAVAGRGASPVLLLDSRAKAAYRRQIAELRAEVVDAEDCADLERAGRARLELDQFVEALAQATGLAGRTRAFTDEDERARVSVHKAIDARRRHDRRSRTRRRPRDRRSCRHRAALRVPAPRRRLKSDFSASGSRGCRCRHRGRRRAGCSALRR